MQAENSDFAVDYNNTADGKLDAAINKYLNAKGFNYNTANDKDYQKLIHQSKKNAGKGKEQSVLLANQFANGYYSLLRMLTSLLCTLLCHFPSTHPNLGLLTRKS